MSTATPGTSVVLDASVAFRAEVDRDEQALHWFTAAAHEEVHAVWPDLALVEIAHGLLRLARTGWLSVAEALRMASRLLAAPVSVEPVAPLTLPAYLVAAERKLSVYDATYVVLAESRNAQLVTADRRLAASTEKSVLIGE